MGSQCGTFKAVLFLYEVQIIKRNTFGMELVELATSAAVHDTLGVRLRAKIRNRTKQELKTASADGQWAKVRVTRTFLSIALIYRIRICVRNHLAGLKDIHT